MVLVTKTLNTHYPIYENIIILLRDFNAGTQDTVMASSCESYNLTNLIKQPTYLKNPRNIVVLI